MKVPKISGGSGFGLGNILGLIFILVGVLLVLSLLNYDLPIDLRNIETVLQYGAAIGSILGGMSMLFKKKEAAPTVQVK